MAESVVTGGPMVATTFRREQQDETALLPNLQRRKFWLESENRWIRLRLITARGPSTRTASVARGDAARGEHV
jgi:hypothetical protein